LACRKENLQILDTFIHHGATLITDGSDYLICSLFDKLYTDEHSIDSDSKLLESIPLNQNKNTITQMLITLIKHKLVDFEILIKHMVTILLKQSNDILKLIIDNYPEILKEKNIKDSESLLSNTIYINNFEIAKYLIDKCTESTLREYISNKGD